LKKATFDRQYDNVVDFLNSKDSFNDEQDIDILFDMLQNLGNQGEYTNKPLLDLKNQLNK